MASTGSNLKEVSTHFRFGENWASYSSLIDNSRVEQATRDLVEFLGQHDLTGRTFLDIGSGSGLHALAALRLGAQHVTAIDIDPDSVATTRATLSAHFRDDRFHCRQLSIFDADSTELGTFDVVYSWGVLHHTGAMHEAIRRASGFVSEGGLLALAIYRKTVLCGFWKLEKRAYSALPRPLQNVLIKAYSAKSRIGALIKGRDFSKYLADYQATRGMDYEHDIHDWLGGYPYESMTPLEFRNYVEGLGFVCEQTGPLDDRALRTMSSGGCQELRFRRAA